MLTQIINAKILTPQGWLKDGSVLMRDNKILEVTNCDLAVIGAELIDAKGMYVVPGGVEIHCHGGGGGDFMEGTEEAFRTAINAHMKHGTTSIFPTLSSSTVPMIEAAAETCTRLMAEPDSPAQNRPHRRRFSAARLPDQPERLVPPQVERNAVHRLHVTGLLQNHSPAADREKFAQIPHRQQRRRLGKRAEIVCAVSVHICSISFSGLILIYA